MEKAVPFRALLVDLLKLLSIDCRGYRGVVRERDLSIKQDKECAEPAGSS